MNNKNISYAVEQNPNARGEADRFLVRSYCQTDTCKFAPRILYVGNEEVCSSYGKKLSSGEIKLDDFVPIRVAAATPCYIKNAEGLLDEMVALADADDNVYLGKCNQYDSCGHYFNGDDSLTFISKNYDALDVLADGAALFSQTKLYKTGCFTRDEVDNIRMIGLYVKLN